MPPSLDYISLKPNCTNRLFKANSFTPSKDAFLLTNFTSKTFIDNLLEAHKEEVKEGTSIDNFEQIVYKIESDFAKLQSNLESVKQQLISKAYSYFSKERLSLEQEKLREELEDLHKKALETDFDKGILDHFADTYNHLKTKLGSATKQLNKSLLYRFENMTNQITKDLNNVLESCVNQSKKEIVPIPEPINKPTSSNILQYTSSEVIHESNRELKGCWLEFDGKYPLLCVGFDKKLGNEPQKTSLYSIKKGKLCQSMYSSHKLPQAYCSKLKCLAFCSTRMNEDKKELLVELLRIGSKGARKVSQLIVELDSHSHTTFSESPLLNYSNLLKGSDIKLMFIDSSDILMIKESHRITLVNIFTKKIIHQKDYDDGVLDINYLKDFKSVMVLTSRRILLYTINDKNHILCEFYSLKLTENETSCFSSGRLFIEHNSMFVSLYQENSNEPYRPCIALEILDSEIRSFNFLVHHAIKYVPVINSKERKVCLFGILPWQKSPRSRRDIIFDLETGQLDDGCSYDDLSELKNIIYADSHKAIIQKRLESGVQKITFSDSNALMRRAC